MPVDVLDDPVDVLLELPGQARLADARRPGDGQDPQARVPAGQVELLAQNKPAFGVYAPANPRAGRGGRGGAPTAYVVPPPQAKTPQQLAQDAVAYKGADYIFDGSM